MDLKYVFNTTGFILKYIAFVMIVPCICALMLKEYNAIIPFACAFLISLFLGSILINKKTKKKK